MTLPYQRTSAVLAARAFLLRLCSPYNGGIKGIRSEVRAEARGLLKHFPNESDLSRVEGDVFGPVETSSVLGKGPVLVDPPSGWLHGFPKLWDRQTPFREWLLANGYPEADIDLAMGWSRFILPSKNTPKV